MQNYKKLDDSIKFRYYDDKINAVKSLGYSYISEAVIDLYINQEKSMPEIAKMMDGSITQQVIGLWLKKWNIKRRTRGGDTSSWSWPENCIYCNELTQKNDRQIGMHSKCLYKFRRRTKNWIIKYSKSDEGLTRLKKDLGIAHHVDNKLLISVLNRS